MSGRFPHTLTHTHTHMYAHESLKCQKHYCVMGFVCREGRLNGKLNVRISTRASCPEHRSQKSQSDSESQKYP